MYVISLKINKIFLNNNYFLKGFRLDFNTYSKTWNGCPSTVVPDPENHVWGVLWQLDMKDLDNLDQQEGVPKKRYLPFEANITTPDGEIVLCRSYMLVNQPIKQIPLPQERRPSKTYLETIVLGANESNLPFEYIKFLNEIPNNGKEGPKMPWSKIQS